MSTVDLTRLRRGELIVGASAMLMLLFLFVPSWYSLKGVLSQTAANLGASTSWDGWWGLGALRYLILVTILVGILLLYFQAAERAPAIPVTLAAIVSVLGTLSVLAMIYRLLAGPPSGGAFLHQQAGPWLGLLTALGIAYGGFASMREESGTPPSQLEIETVRLGDRAAS